MFYKILIHIITSDHFYSFRFSCVNPSVQGIVHSLFIFTWTWYIEAIRNNYQSEWNLDISGSEMLSIRKFGATERVHQGKMQKGHNEKGRSTEVIMLNAH